MKKEDAKELLILLLIGLITRLYALSHIYLIAKDGAFQYVPLAKLFAEGNYIKALHQPQLPLYPFLISLVSHTGLNFEVSGQIVSIIFSLLAVIPIYWIAKRLFNEQVGFWVSLLYLIHPVMLRSSVDVLKESLFICLFFAAVYYALLFMEEGRKTSVLWLAIFVFLGTLVRIVILEIPLLLGIWGCVRSLRKDGLKTGWLITFLFTLGILVALAGLVIWNSNFFADKKFYQAAKRIYYLWSPSKFPSLLGVFKVSIHIIVRFVQKSYPLPLVLSLFGLCSRVKNKELSAGEQFVLILMAGLFVIFVFNMYASSRYLLPVIFMSYLWAGYGFVKLREVFNTRIRKFRKFANIFLVVFLISSVLVVSLRAQRLDKIGRKEVGLLIKGWGPPSPRIVTNVSRVAYYAGGQHILVTSPIQPIILVHMGVREAADYLVIEEKKDAIQKQLSPFEKQGQIRFMLRYPYGRKRKVIYVYRYLHHPVTSGLTVLQKNGALWSPENGWVFTCSPCYVGIKCALDLEFRSDSTYVILYKDGAIWDSSRGWILTTPPYYPGTDYARDLELSRDGSYAVLHRDGAIWNSLTGWFTSTPPYYKGAGYAVDLEYRSDGSFLILHKDGAIYDSLSGWETRTPPYYRGSGYAVDLEILRDSKAYAILHENGAIWFSDSGWLLRSPPYYRSEHTAVDMEFERHRRGYLVLYKKQGVYCSIGSMNSEDFENKSGECFAADMEIKEKIKCGVTSGLE